MQTLSCSNREPAIPRMNLEGSLKRPLLLVLLPTALHLRPKHRAARHPLRQHQLPHPHPPRLLPRLLHRHRHLRPPQHQHQHHHHRLLPCHRHHYCLRHQAAVILQNRRLQALLFLRSAIHLQNGLHFQSQAVQSLRPRRQLRYTAHQLITAYIPTHRRR